MILFTMITCIPETLNTHRLDLMPKIHTSYPIWPLCEKGEWYGFKRVIARMDTPKYGETLRDT